MVAKTERLEIGRGRSGLRAGEREWSMFDSEEWARARSRGERAPPSAAEIIGIVQAPRSRAGRASRLAR